MATAKSSNGPTLIKNDGVFVLNPFTLFVDLTDEVVIEAPVTAVVLFAGVPQPSIVVTPLVTGRTIAATLTTAQMVGLPKRNASLNILFNGEYVIQTPLVPTFEGSVPGTVTTSYESPTLGVFRVSFYHGQTQASLTEADRIACEAARDAIDDLVVNLNDRVPGFLDSMAEKIMAGNEASYTTVGANPLTSSGGSNGATIDIPNKTIQIPNGSSGADSYMRQDFDLTSTSNLRVNDKINIRSKITQTVDGAISGSVIGIRLFTSAGVAVPLSTVAPALYDSATKTYTLDGQFTVTDTALDYYIETFIKSGAPVQPAAVNLRWIDVGINQNKYLYEDAIDLINEAIQAYKQIAVTFDDQPIVTAIDMSGVTDVTAALQAEINLAISTSGKWRGRTGTPRITASLTLGGRIDMDFGGMDLNANIATIAPAIGSEAFTIFTALPVALRNLIIRRAAANVSQQPTPVRFSASFVNKDSVFERIQILNIPRGFTLDYCDNLKLIECSAGGGQFYGLRAGASAPGSMTNLKIYSSVFEAYLDNHAQIYNVDGLVLERNLFRSLSSTTFPNRSVELLPTTQAIQKMARIADNQFLAYREYGLYMLPAAGVTVRDFTIRHNLFDDRTLDAVDNSSRGMQLDGGGSSAIDMLHVIHNDIYCKEIGIRANNIKVARFQNNNFYKSNVGGAYATSQAIVGTGLTFITSNNFLDSNLAVASNKATWGTEITTVI